MLVDFTKTITGPDGEPVTKEDGKTELTLKILCRNAVLNSKSSNECSGVQKMDRALLARRINDSQTTLDLNIDDLKIVKDCVGEVYNPWIMASIWDIIDPKGA